MVEAKPVKTPMSTSSTFSSDAQKVDATLYRSLVGSLQYLALTRPDVAFSINRLAQQMQVPSNDHFQTLKRVLRYLKSTIRHGVHLHWSNPCSFKHTVMQTGQVTPLTDALQDLTSSILEATQFHGLHVSSALLPGHPPRLSIAPLRR